MSESIASENSPLYLRAKQAILDLITGALSQGNLEANKLPPEEELCLRLGVSRPTVREALMALSRDGVITKKHGTGNLVHPSALEPRMRFDTHTDFVVLLRDKGHEVEMQCTPLRHSSLSDEALLENCGGSRGEGLFQERMLWADGMPAVLCYSFVRMLAEDTAMGEACGEVSFAEFLRGLCGEQPSHVMTRIQPTTADARVAEFFGMEAARPVLRLLEGHYGIHDTLLAESVVYFNPAMLDLSILRKW